MSFSVVDAAQWLGGLLLLVVLAELLCRHWFRHIVRPTMHVPGQHWFVHVDADPSAVVDSFRRNMREAMELARKHARHVVIIRQ